MPLGGSTADPSWPAVAVQVDFAHDPTSMSYTWTDLSAKSWKFSCIRGRSHEQSSVDAGTGSVTWDNRDGNLDPTNASGSYYPNVIPFRRMQVTATYNGTVYPVYAGMVERWPMSWDNTLGKVMSPLSDYFSWLGNVKLRSCYEQEVLADSPVAFYPLTEPSGATSGGDVSRNGQPPLTVFQEGAGGDATFGGATGIPTDGTATLTLNGTLTGSDSVDIGMYLVSQPFTWANPGTVEAWFSIGSTFAAALNAAGGGTCYLAGMLGSHGTPTGVALKYNAGAIQVLDLSNAPIGPDLNDGKVHHVVVVYPGSVSRQCTYIDGIAYGSTFTSSVLTLSGQQLNVGGADPMNVGFGGLPQPLFRGGIGYVAVYSTALAESRIAAHYQAGSKAFAGETADARISRILGYAAWTGPTALDPCSTTVQAATGLSGQSALAAIQTVAQSEGGTFYVSRDGTPTYKSRRTRMQTVTSTYTFGDGPGELPYDAIGFDYDPTFIYNDVQITRTTNAVAAASDATSRGHYGIRTLPKTMSISSDTEALDAANWLLGIYKDPHLRVAGLTLNPGSNPNLWPMVLSLEIGTRVTVKRRPPGSPNTISSDFYVEQVSHQVGPRQWMVGVALSPVGLQALIADDPIYGVCDSTYVAAW